MGPREANTRHSKDGVRVPSKDGEEEGPGSSSLHGEDRSRVGSKVHPAKVYLESNRAEMMDAHYLRRRLLPSTTTSGSVR